MSALLVGAVMGALFAGGTLLLVMQSRRARRPDARVLPYVQVTGFDWAREPAESSKWLSSEQLRRLLNSIVTDASVQRRLDQANSGIDLNAFRVDQLRWACFGAAGAIGFGLIRVLAHEPIPVPIWFLFTLGAAFAGAMLRDYRLSQEARRRIEVITSELPGFAELLAFTVAAGLAPASALSRVANRVGGEFAIELRACCDQVAAGRPFTDALEALAHRTGSESVQRFVDGIVVAIERGTPIAEVLRAQAIDARAASHRQLMESAGKREIFALVPVVFLILPAVVVVAVFPGIFGLVVATG